MKWEDREESSNVEDRRGLNKKTGIAIGGLGGLVIVILGLIFGFDPQQFLGGNGLQPDGQSGEVAGPEEERQAHFAKIIFHDTEVVWDEQFQVMGKRYEKPTLTLFRHHVDSACGWTESAVGPFYCPGDSHVYIDLAFFQDMQDRLKAPGEFARAYVIAHEVGHHVQRLLGYSRKVDETRRTGSKVEANKMSVRLELQADYFAGVWAYYGQKKYQFLEEGDLKSALNAAFQIGDDRLQKRATGHVVKDSFTHGTSQQRMRWFQRGFKTGDVERARALFDLEYNEL
jgi:predicted metalloprotease